MSIEIEYTFLLQSADIKKRAFWRSNYRRDKLENNDSFFSGSHWSEEEVT